MAAEPKTRLDVTYVGTFAPIVAHIQHPRMIDRTLCGCRVRWRLRAEQVERMGVCHACRQALGEEKKTA